MSVAAGLASLDQRATWARRILLTYIIAVAAAFPISFAVVFSIRLLALDPAIMAVALVGFGLVGLALFVAIAVSVPMWVHRAWANLYAIGVDHLRFSPGWAAGSFFVPIVGIWVPFRAMRQLANRSFGEEEYHANASVPDVTSWWACFIGGMFIQFANLGIDLFNRDGVVLIVAPPLIELLTTLLGVVLMVAAAWFLRRVIGAVTEAQKSVTGIHETFA